MSWLFSQALVAEYSADTCLDGEPFVPSSGQPTQQAYCSPDKMTEFSRLSRFGMTYRPLTAGRGEELLTSYLAAFHVKTSAQPVQAMGSPANARDYGVLWRELSVKYDRDTCSWKTHRSLLDEDLAQCSLTLPRWGSMRNGVLSERVTSALPMRDRGYGLLPTPTRSWGKKGIGVSRNKANGRYAAAIVDRCIDLINEFGWKWPCNMLETMMGWPLGWSALKPLEMAKFREWQRQHGGF